MKPRRVRWRSSLRWALGALGVVALGLAVVEIAVLARSPLEPHWVLMMLPATGLVSLGAGLVAWDRRPSNRLGVLLVTTGVVWLAAGLANTALPVPTAVGQIVATMPLALTIHALLAFPEGRVTGGTARVVVGAAYVVAVALQAPQYLFTADGPPFDVLAVTPRPGLVDTAETSQRVAGTLVTLAATWVLVRRAAAASPVHRRVLVPVSVYGILAVLFAILSGNVLEPFLGLDPIARLAVQLVILAGVPIAFAAALLLGRFGRAGEVAELAMGLGDGEDRDGWTVALAATLGDPTVRLLFWLPDRSTYADIDGRPVELPAPGGDRSVSPITVGGRVVGALEYDPLANPDPELIAAAGDVIALAVDRQRLMVELRESRTSLRASRARLVEATDRERRRIALDLHDGVQARLLGLALQAGRLGRVAGSDGSGCSGGGEVAVAAGELEAGIMRCAGELRSLVHGIVPALLIERGLFAATEDLVDSIPVPTVAEFDGGDGSLPAAVESTAYFVIAEALTNAAKHARASSLSVRVRREPEWLRIEVRDDGVGGARPDGVGMRSIADRVDVVGGRLALDSPPGQGTALVAELPCAS